MRRFFSLTLALLMLCFLAACAGSQEQEQKVEVKGGIAEVSEALEYDFLGYNTSGTTLSFDSAAVVDDNIAQALYKNGKSEVTLRMTLDKDKAEGLAGYRNAGTAGAIEAPTDVFSKLSIQVVDNSTYFCEFTYTNCGCSCFLSLAETKTNLDLYSTLLIDYVNQLYNMEGIPSYVYKVDPSLKEEETPAESSEAEAASVSAEAEPSAEPEKESAEESGEATAEESDKESAKEEEEAEEKDSEKEDSEKKESEKEDSEKKETEKENSEKEESEKEDSEKKESEEKKEKEEEKASGSITLTYYDITLVSIGDYYTFEPKGGKSPYTWKSANKKVATVSEDGTVKAVGKGTTTVTVKSKDGITAEVIVRVPGK